MYRVTRCIVVCVTAMSMVMMPGVSDYAVAQAPVSVINYNQHNVIVLSNTNDTTCNADNIAMIKHLNSAHQNRIIKNRAEVALKKCGVYVTDAQRNILERIVEAEAGGENHKGKLLVANVILNRVKNKTFPSSIKGVVFAHSGSTYQFSPISDGRYYTVSVSSDTKSAVEDALKGIDPSMGALYFMERSIADSDNVSWFDRCLTKLFRYHCHEFYK